MIAFFGRIPKIEYHSDYSMSHSQRNFSDIIHWDNCIKKEYRY